MMRITAYADRLLDDLDVLDWPEQVKTMQRNWIGRSTGAAALFAATIPAGDRAGSQVDIEVFTTRPDTLFGATYLVLAPEHDRVDELVAAAWPEDVSPSWTYGAATPVDAVAAYRGAIAAKSDLERQESREKTGVFLGSYAINPANGEPVPIFIADYVLAGYGTGAIMAVPGHDQRDWDFARAFGLPVVEVIAGGDISQAAYTGDGVLVNSGYLDGMNVAEAKPAITARLESEDRGRARIEFKLRDWLFARQRYWGEPFPIVYDGDGRPHALDETALPVELPEVADHSPVLFDPDDADSEPSPPLAKATGWVNVELDLGDGLKRYSRDTNVMPQWAGSSWYELRYTDPHNSERFCARENEAYWMGPRPVEHGRRTRRRRLVRRWRRARGAASAVFAVLAQGLVRPGSRELTGALSQAHQPGLHSGVRLHRRARILRAGRSGDRTRRALFLPGFRRRDRGLPGIRQNR
ncbi:tRNA synthetases class I family protein [Mycobacterium kansasii 732]|nr:tRNA synthetases class I family protein [Mycobacterium kansasii 732]